VSEKVRLLRYIEGKAFYDSDEIAVEEPLKLTISHKDISRTIYIMRTPIDDKELVIGFLFTQGIIKTLEDIEKIYEDRDFLMVELKNPFSFEREAIINSSCGICGNPSLIKIFSKKYTLKVNKEVIMEIPKKMVSLQKIFLETGGLHAAGVFNVDGEPLFIEEDVGRHNAVDKVIGKLIISRLDPSNLILQVSGRVGYEIAEKAAIAGFPIISAISAPTTSAVGLCEFAGISLVGFVRGNKLNIYSHPERII
jgi:FdhD protein